MHNILVTSAGRRVSLVRSLRQELKALLPQAEVFAAEAVPDLSAACRDSGEMHRLPRLDDPGYIDALEALASALGVGLVIPTIDTELLLLARERDRFRAKGIELLVCDEALIAMCRDKRKTHTFFTERGIPVPAYVNPRTAELPFFVKPYDGSCSQGARMITDRTTLTDELLNDERMMFLEPISSREFSEFTLDLYYDRSGTLRCVVPRQRLEIRAGEVSKGVTRRQDTVDYIFDRMGSLEGARGCVTLQLFRHHSKPLYYGIEINPRFGGGYPLSYHAGANFPRWLIEEYLLHRSVERFDNWQDNLLMLRYDAEVLVTDYRV
ncbi:MAG: ATP-grasp domain-containing protein [Bdellovibrionales bacterium]|nr:ATP-grasp domain-containing protein [Bdellovibrionales bacterium]